MEIIKVPDKEWALLKRRLFSRGLSALHGYPCPVKLVHGQEYVIYDVEKECKQ